MSEWQSVDTAPEGKVVETKIDDGNGVRNEARLKRQGRLWFFPDGSMYVYYRPTHWKPVPTGAPSIASDGGSVVEGAEIQKETPR